MEYEKHQAHQLIIHLSATILRILAQVDSSTSLTELDDVLVAIQQFSSKWPKIAYFEKRVAVRLQEILKAPYTSEMKAVVQAVMVGKYGLEQSEEAQLPSVTLKQFCQDRK
jgi:hypothetical protein